MSNLEVDMNDGEDYEEIQETFGFFDPTPEDANGIVHYIPKVLHVEPIELAVIVANQGRVGTLIKNEISPDEPGESLFGFVSCINIGVHMNHNRAVAQIYEWLLSLGDPQLCELLHTSVMTTGLILSERAYGVPPEIAPHINRSIFEEIAWATEDLPTQEEREMFMLTHFIMVRKGVTGDEGIEFPLVEDEFYFNNAALKLEFQTEGEEGDLAELDYHRYVLVLTKENIDQARIQLNEAFNIDEAQYADEGVI